MTYITGGKDHLTLENIAFLSYVKIYNLLHFHSSLSTKPLTLDTPS